ncbi:LysR family transcriptional regulator [Marinibactrum halimedae]|uniref:HTH lysR-type domain-containing protein n=1 Tax=Marinibactrum halimedae TaxID=1444977 RepID=A0AA37WNR1_9GAMM|nr:LysR family transcriptional regulator [Marinibactrum halimedae]MCD9460139.1 LysR family transcriptional regulator [Marinibactrum halimedae]GLS26391.1 hypothetical protein GCM10007877_21060 [Marinibactrum halimedae]
MQLNYKHLRYFMVVAEEGSIARAAERLHLAPQTISAQITQLEESLNTPLLRRVGKEWIVTDSGAIALKYAKDIFDTGKEMTEVLRGSDAGKPLDMMVGITDAIPKVVAYKMLEPVLKLGHVRLHCREGDFDSLVAQLSVHSLDLVLADRPLSQQLHVKAQSYLLKESGVSIMMANHVAPQASFPECLQGMPFLLPSEHHWLSRSLEDWFDTKEVNPVIRGRFDDTALLKIFARAGVGACCMPTIIEQDIAREYGLTCLGRIEEVKEFFYGITVERRVPHAGVDSILGNL